MGAHPRTRISGGALAVTLVIVACSGDWRDDTIACEEAVQHLAACCPGFDPTAVSCHYDYESGCGSKDWQYPALDPEESACVLRAECAHLEPSGVCARARAAMAYTIHENTDDGGVTSMGHDPVCK
jgi:hypothetical protein